jgi:hypothetical protein
MGGGKESKRAGEQKNRRAGAHEDGVTTTPSRPSPARLVPPPLGAALLRAGIGSIYPIGRGTPGEPAGAGERIRSLSRGPAAGRGERSERRRRTGEPREARARYSHHGGPRVTARQRVSGNWRHVRHCWERPPCRSAWPPNSLRTPERAFPTESDSRTPSTPGQTPPRSCAGALLLRSRDTPPGSVLGSWETRGQSVCSGCGSPAFKRSATGASP